MVIDDDYMEVRIFLHYDRSDVPHIAIPCCIIEGRNYQAKWKFLVLANPITGLIVLPFRCNYRLCLDWSGIDQLTELACLDQLIGVYASKGSVSTSVESRKRTCEWLDSRCDIDVRD